MLTKTKLPTSEPFAGVGVAVQRNGYDTILDLPVGDVIDLFKKAGFVAFTGFNVDTASFEKFSNQFSSDYMDHTGGGSLRQVINKDGDKTILSVAYNYNPEEGQFGDEQQKTFGLPLHADRSYTHSQPPLMWFMCEVPSKNDGQTTIADGVKLFDALSDRSKEVFTKNKIDYIRHYVDGEWQLWAGTDDLEKVKAYCAENELDLTITPENGVKTHSLKSAVVTPRWTDKKAFVNSIPIVMWQEKALNSQRSIVRLEGGSPIPGDVLDDMWKVCNDNTHEISWQPGDLVMIDNTRMMHGRRAFTGRDRKVYVRMARSVPF
jgi:alpha-ketoglutarate-dependent taurine dioxygenase